MLENESPTGRDRRRGAHELWLVMQAAYHQYSCFERRYPRKVKAQAGEPAGIGGGLRTPCTN
jgi:hypothetical protein